MKASLPLSIQDQYQNLRTSDLAEDQRAETICRVFAQVVSFLGKLALLEYLQGSCQSAVITYQLMQSPILKTPYDWIKWFDRINSEFSRREIMPVVRELMELWEKYPSLRQEAGSEDRIARLVWFYGLQQNGGYLVSPADIQENEEYLTILLDEFSFLATARYREENEETVLFISGKKLQLSPFYKVRNDKMALIEQKNGTMEKACQIWIPEALRQYNEEKCGKLDFEPIIAAHRDGYILAPWLEIVLEEALENIFATIDSVESENVLSIEGHPGAGKTALAANLARFFEKFHFLCYFVRGNTPLQTIATFEKWLIGQLSDYFQLSDAKGTFEISNEELLKWLLECRQAFAKKSQKIVVAVDGIENMPATEYAKLRRFIQHEPLNRMVFLFFKRMYHAPNIAFARSIALQCKDNVRFEESFIPEYLQNLKQCYFQSEAAMEIFTVMAREPYRFFSVVDLAKATGIFTPRVLKTVLSMKPLWEISREVREDFPTQVYRVFHPVCQSLFDMSLSKK